MSSLTRWKFSSLVTCTTLGAMTLAGISCREPGYRTEVVTGAEGQVQVNHVPYTAPAEPARQQQTAAAQAVEQSGTPAAVVATDADLRDVEAAWPQVSPEDRKRIADMVKRLAKPAN